ncbi:probable aldehyde oxidase 2 [Aricia agestis]|uniref:probable aldehyde oxidase 2 n=1 Tax=Aricia agestis TaxID=91739 RepID=UPI001C201944|nr:probable aldehyde oxidase 2 [Aricia agestis]
MSKILFKINGRQYEADGTYSPDVSLNEFIRNVANLRGTKSMCHEGGCGACVVAVQAALPPDNEAKTFAVNSCLVSVLSCHGWEVTTVEGVGNRTMGYHDIQNRLAQFNGTQCGYCTPGWIMNMYSLYTSKNGKLMSSEVENSFAGNICRCTGYRPIADAFKSFAVDADERLLSKVNDIEDLALLSKCRVKCNATRWKENNIESDSEWCIVNKTSNNTLTLGDNVFKWFKVYNLSEVFKIISQNVDYKFIAGNTGQGVYHVTEYPPIIIDIFNVVDLKGYTLDINLIVGAGTTLTDMMELFTRISVENEDFSYLSEFVKHLDLVAHVPVRNIGTIAGNLFLKYTNNDFPSDLFLLFETIDAMITIGSGVNNRQTMSFSEFLTINMTGKIIINIMLPPLPRLCKIKTYKIMARSQNTHAIVNAGFLFKFKPNQNILEKVNIVYGNISPSFIHATETEKILIDKDPFTEETLQLALKSLDAEIAPEDAPPEPSAKYRKQLALALYYKAILSLCPESKVNPKYVSGGNVIKRNISQGTQTFDTDESVWPLNKPIPKLEALVQCSGEATFANDLPAEIGEVFAAFVTADVLPGSIISGFDATAALELPGVQAFYTAKDIPGSNTFAPLDFPLVTEVEEILCNEKVAFHGQPAGIIVASREKLAIAAARLVKINYEFISVKNPVLTVHDAIKSSEASDRVKTSMVVDPTDIGNDVKSKINDQVYFDSQYHYYMEPQTCVVKPTEDGLDVYASAQWMDLINVAIAGCLNVPVNSVSVIVRRVGGAYGGKISRASQIACAAALVSYLQGRTCRLILPIEKNMSISGNRSPTYCNFEVGVNAEGEIQYLKNKYYQDLGCSINDSFTSITVNHFPSCYNSSRWHIESYNVITDKSSMTWCRAPATTEGIATTEYIMERIAFEIKKDAIDVRLQNMKKEDNPIPELIDYTKKISDYDTRLKAVVDYNKNNRWRKRAIKLLPMTYDLFYLSPFNAIVSVYHRDGTVSITHGATEMGQGVNTKVAQVAAYALGIPLEDISVKPSSSVTSPNCMATGGSVGSECVSYATLKACEIIKERLEEVKKKMDNPTWKELVKQAYQSGVYLQASYQFTTNGPIKPYDIFGVVVLEVEVDILTGNHEILRVDLLEDTGRSLSPSIDVGQIEGAFVMGLGYWTSEKLIYDQTTGKLLTDRTWTYKPPGIKDVPADFRIYFRRNSTNESGVLQSKATGEPALCMAVVITHALREAVRAARLDAGYEDQWVQLDIPCTTENIFMAVEHKIEHYKLK